MNPKFRKWYFSRRGLILIPFFSVLGLCFWNEYENDYVTWPVGFCLIILGIILRIWAIKYIGKDARKRNLKVKTLVTMGPYAIIRNPLYLANIIIVLGFCITSELIWYLPILLVVLIIHYNIVVRCEESFLLEKFGDEYLQYKKNIPRWLPKISNLKYLGLPYLTWRESIKKEALGATNIIFGMAIMLAKELFDDFIIKGG